MPAGTSVGPQGGSAAPKNEYLSDQSPVDQDPGADTAYVKDGGYTADGVYYDHAVEMDGGCQNGDGGDMWADWNLDRSWSYLTGVVALSDDAITGSDISYAVYLDGRKAASGSVGIGQSVPIRLNVSGVFRVRLWMNDPRSPNDACGFSSVPYLVWGNLTASTGSPVSAQGSSSGSALGNGAPAPEFLSSQNLVDQDPGADTAYVKDGGYTADGVYYDHAVEMDGGCQNGDGGDMWADWNLDRSWTQLAGTVALADGAASGSHVSYAVYLDGRKAASGSVGIGQSVPIRLNVSGVFRVRLWMNDPRSPNDACGFSSVPYLVWGNLTATT